MSFSARMKSARENKGVTLAQLGDAIGKTEATVQRYESGNIKNLKSDTIELISRYLDVSPAYLMGWDNTNDITHSTSNGSIGNLSDNSDSITINNTTNEPVPVTIHNVDDVVTSQNAAHDTQEEIQEIQKEVLHNIIELSATTKEILTLQKEILKSVKGNTIPFKQIESNIIEEDSFEYRVHERLSAGLGSYVEEDNYDYDTVYHDKKIDYDIASWVYGDSMEPAYLDGEVALIKKTGFDYDGAIYAVVWDGKTYIKKVYREKDGLRLVSMNKKYSDKYAPYEEEPRVIGLVVGHFMPAEK